MNRFLFLLLGVLFLTSCQTIKTDFEEGTNPLIYFQRAQTALDLGDFDLAIKIYDMLLATQPGDPAIIVSAEYELAFLNYKKGNMDLAIQKFEAILKKYADPTQAAFLDVWPQVLSLKLLSKLKPLDGPSPSPGP